MGRYDPPDPLCRHAPKVRVSSHLDLVEASRKGDSIASTYCCDRKACQEDAQGWVRAVAGPDTGIVIIPLGNDVKQKTRSE
jgi:hypothetical protein